MIKIYKYGEVADSEIFGRSTDSTDVSAIVSDIITKVRQEGDDALKFYADKFDGGAPDSFIVSDEEWEEAYSSVDAELIEVMRRSAENIKAYHKKQKQETYRIEKADGVIVGRRVIPLKRVGLYVPGGTASYPSSVLMNAIPAKIAGVDEVIMVSPAKSGKLNPVVLAAAKIAGVDKVIKIGGAQAVAALAFGTESVPMVDKIVGPGNAFVAEAKKQVYGQVAIDMIAGPSEILVVADKNSNPAWIAADLLSQAEHDKLASSVLVTDSEDLAKAVQNEIENQLKTLPREEIARCSIDNFGKIIVADNLSVAVDISNRIAPEHLELSVDEPFEYLEKVRNAGSVFLGRYCPESLGDYYSGPNHTLPTLGTARFSSPLSVEDFVKYSAFSYYTAEAVKKAAPLVAKFARSEGLEAHARAAEIRGKED